MKKLDKEIEQAWYRLASGVQVNIMDIPKITREVKDAVLAGASVDDATIAAREKYRLN